VVGFLGRFVPEKGIPLLLEALRKATAPWRALFVGGGPLQNDLERFALEYPGRVHVANGVAHDEVPAWLSAMTLLCAPSQTTPGWREQFGRMLIEAMACGVPVVGTAAGGLPEVVEEGVCGFLRPVGDVEGMAEAALGLLEDEERWRRFSAEARRRAVEVFPAGEIVPRYRKLYEETLG
jgi:glycosyltransferase involved in cell wall biosynthesis